MTDTSNIVLETIPHMYFFDVDGPIVEPNTESITHPEILQHICTELKEGRPVALVTGRGTAWLIKEPSEDSASPTQQPGVVTLIEKLVENPSHLDNFFVSAEFGGATITYEQGSRHVHTNPDLTLPTTFTDPATEIIVTEFPATMLIEPKDTQFTAKIQPLAMLESNRQSFSDFKEDQNRLVRKFQDMLDASGLSDQFEVHQDRIATNVRDKGMNKVFATEEVLYWMKKKGFAPEEYIIFADSKSDFEIADAIVDDPDVQESNSPVTLVYLGEKNEVQQFIDAKPEYTIDVRTYDDLTEGTAKFLRERTLS